MSIDDHVYSDEVFVVYTRTGKSHTDVRIFTDKDEARRHYAEQREVYVNVKGVTYRREDEFGVNY